MFREPWSSLHQGKEQPDKLFLRVLPFYILRYLWRGGGGEENCEWEGGEKGGRNQSVLINRENSFPYFIYVVAIISI